MKVLTIVAAFFCITLASVTASAADPLNPPLETCANSCNQAAQDTGDMDLKVPCATAACNYMDADPNHDVNNCKLKCSFTFNQTIKDYTGKTKYDWCAFGCDSYPTE